MSKRHTPETLFFDPKKYKTAYEAIDKMSAVEFAKAAGLWLHHALVEHQVLVPFIAGGFELFLAGHAQMFSGHGFSLEHHKIIWNTVIEQANGHAKHRATH